jgi:hypothetical protein
VIAEVEDLQLTQQKGFANGQSPFVRVTFEQTNLLDWRHLLQQANLLLDVGVEVLVRKIALDGLLTDSDDRKILEMEVGELDVLWTERFFVVTSTLKAEDTYSVLKPGLVGVRRVEFNLEIRDLRLFLPRDVTFLAVGVGVVNR